MKRILLATFIIFSSFLNAQEVQEPEFIGETFLVNSDNTNTLLEKQLTQSRSAASTGLFLTGIGKVRNQIQIDGCCASTVIDSGKNIELIIKAVDNNSDPLSIIKIFKFEKKKKYRRAELSSYSSLGSSKSNNIDYVTNFSGKKYGKSSYYIKVNNLTPGEYGVTISNPNNLDEKQIVISSFAVK